MYPPVPAFFIGPLTREDEAVTQSQNGGNEYPVIKAQYPRRTCNERFLKESSRKI
jgi:hypothetical protein